MGIFGSRHPKQSPDDVAAATAQEVADEQYRNELRELGRTHFKELIDKSAEGLRQDIDDTMKQVAGDLKQYMSRQLDIMVAGVSTEITNQLREQITDYNRLATEARENTSQSLARSSQEMHEKYQQLSTNLQETITNQEVMIGKVFQDNKDRIAAAEQEQKKILETLQETTELSRHESEKIYHMMSQTTRDQAERLAKVYQENLDRVTNAGEAHSAALETLYTSTQALQKQQQQLSTFLDTSVAEQKTMVMQALNENMARIVEHYIVKALGDNSDLKAQLPLILEKMEKNKQAMMDDIAL